MSDSQRVPTALVLDLPSIQAELRLAASAMAMNVATSSDWRPAERDWNTVMLDTWASAGRTLVSFGQWKYEGQGAQVVSQDGQKYLRLREENYRLFTKNFLMAAASGPMRALGYLQEKIRQRKYAQAAVAEKFESARQINREVTAALDRGINFFFAARTIANTAGVVAGALVSLPVALTFGIGYSIAAALAESIGQGEAADLVTFVQPPTVSAAATVAQEYCHGPSKVVDEAFVREANLLSQQAEARLARLRASPTVRSMGATGERMVAKAEAEAVRANANAARATASGAGARGLKVAGTGAAILVGLWFMREDLAKMGKWITTGESYTEQMARR